MSSTLFTPADTTVTGVTARVEEVGRLVEGLARAAVHPAQIAGRENANTRRRSDRRRPTRASRRENGQVAHTRLGEIVVSDAPHTLSVEADARHAVEHRDGGGSNSRDAQNAFELDRRRVVARARQPVADDRRLEGHDGPAGGESLSHLVRQLQGGVHRLRLPGGGSTAWPSVWLSARKQEAPRGERGACGEPGETRTPNLLILMWVPSNSSCCSLHSWGPQK